MVGTLHILTFHTQCSIGSCRHLNLSLRPSRRTAGLYISAHLSRKNSQLKLKECLPATCDGLSAPTGFHGTNVFAIHGVPGANWCNEYLKASRQFLHPPATFRVEWTCCGCTVGWIKYLRLRQRIPCAIEIFRRHGRRWSKKNYIYTYKSLHFRTRSSCRRSQKVP